MNGTESFTQEIKDEICSLEIDNIDQKKSILGAFIKRNGTLVFKSRDIVLVLMTEGAHIAKFIYNIIKELYPDANLSFAYRKSMKFYKSTQYLININSMVDDIKEDLELDFLEDKIPFNLTNKDEKVRGYFQGLFLTCGSCNNPSSSNYHFEFYLSKESDGKAVIKLLNKIKTLEFNFKTIQRRNNTIVYLKKSDQISSFLAFLDANNCCLNFENIRVDRDFSNITNRLMNCDTYNYKKSTASAKEQLKNIEIIEKNYGYEYLNNKKIENLCKIRQRMPEASFQELADELSSILGVKVSKSNVNHLFIKIKTLAEPYKK